MFKCCDGEEIGLKAERGEELQELDIDALVESRRARDGEEDVIVGERGCGLLGVGERAELNRGRAVPEDVDDIDGALSEFEAERLARGVRARAPGDDRAAAGGRRSARRGEYEHANIVTEGRLADDAPVGELIDDGAPRGELGPGRDGGGGGGVTGPRLIDRERGTGAMVGDHTPGLDGALDKIRGDVVGGEALRRERLEHNRERRDGFETIELLEDERDVLGDVAWVRGRGDEHAQAGEVFGTGQRAVERVLAEPGEFERGRRDERADDGGGIVEVYGADARVVAEQAELPGADVLPEVLEEWKEEGMVEVGVRVERARGLCGRNGVGGGQGGRRAHQREADRNGAGEQLVHDGAERGERVGHRLQREALVPERDRDGADPEGLDQGRDEDALLGVEL